MNYIALSPQFPEYFWNFCDRLNKNGINVLGIGDTPYDNLNENLKKALCEYYYVEDMHNYDDMMRAVAYFIHKYGRIDYLESNNEYWLETDANLRTDFNIGSGFKEDTIKDIKTKSGMKKYYKKAKIPYARFHMATTFENDQSFIKEVGYPIIAKPDNGVGAFATYKISNDEALIEFYKNRPQVPYIMEEFIHGEIYSYDAIVNDKGKVIFEGSHCFPKSIMDIVNNEDDLSFYTLKEVPKELSEIGKRAVKAFKVASRMVHFEFFKLLKDHPNLGKKGEWIALEANMRPGGGYIPDMLNYAGLCDIYQIYADCIAFNENRQTKNIHQFYCAYASRRYNKTYSHSNAQIKSRYLSAIVMEQSVPDVLSGAMGNTMYAARFHSLEEVNEFITYILD